MGDDLGQRFIRLQRRDIVSCGDRRREPVFAFGDDGTDPDVPVVTVVYNSGYRQKGVGR